MNKLGECSNILFTASTKVTDVYKMKQKSFLHVVGKEGIIIIKSKNKNHKTANINFKILKLPVRLSYVSVNIFRKWLKTAGSPVKTEVAVSVC